MKPNMHTLRGFFAALAGLTLALGTATAGTDFVNGQAADLVLGQKVFTSGTSGLSSSQLAVPRDVAVDPISGKVFVADAKNNRVLRFGSLTKLVNGQPAEIVLGQKSFTSAFPGLSQTTMNSPQSVLVDPAGILWVADTVNRRILRFDKPSAIATGAPANAVLGQPDFTTTGASKLSTPRGLAMINGHLFVADEKLVGVAVFEKASALKSGSNLTGLFGTEVAPLDLAFGAKGVLFVSGIGSSPILRYDGWATPPGNAGPTVALGPVLTNTLSTSIGDVVSGLASDGVNRLFVSDQLNNRILIFDNILEQSAKATASFVLGQKSFLGTGNGTSSRNLFNPYGLHYSPATGMLLVADQSNNRILRYTQGAGAQPDLTVPDVSVSTTLTVQQPFEIVGVVDNTGTATSDPSVLRYFFSEDPTITVADNEIGKPVEFPALSPDDPPLKLGTEAVINSVGTFYVGACADVVPNEISNANNCSVGVKVTVKGLPDLTVPEVAVTPTALMVNQLFEIVGVVENSGSATSGSSTLRYYRSTDSTISTADTPIGTPSAITTLPPGGQVKLSTKASIGTTGTFFIGACADALTSELSTTNNCSVGIKVTVSGQPDLTVPEISADPTSLGIGAPFIVKAAVQNAGTATSSDTTLRYFRSTDSTITTGDAEIGTPSAVGSLTPGGSVTPSTEASISEPGTHFIGACVDPVAGESSTTNNCSAAVKVTVAAPDLTVPEISLSATTLDIDEGFDIKAAVQNVGSAAADPSSLRYFRSVDSNISTADTEIGTPTAISSLDAGLSETLNGSASIDTGGTFFVGACADVVPNESNGSNNCSIGIQVTVSGAAILEILSPPTVSPTSLAPGGTFNISVDVTNSGDADSSDTQVKYYRSEDGTIGTSDTEIGTPSNLGVLAPAATQTVNSDASINTSGTFFVGACVIASGNCSSGVQVDVFNGPDLVPATPSVTPNAPLSQEQFDVSTSVSNNGDQASTATTVRFYASTDETIETTDTELGAGDAVTALDPGITSMNGVTGVGPLTDGTWWIGACVETFTGEADDTNNCSGGTQIVVNIGPDLSVAAPTVEPSSPAPEQLVVASTTVTNLGDTNATAESVQFYYSTDSTIGTDDTPFGLPVSINDSLSPGQFASAEKTSSAPAMNGEFWFGACVTPVTNDADTGNDCSPGTKVVVSDGTGAELETAFDAFDSMTDLTDNDADGNVSPGDAIDLGVTVSNVGAADADNVSLTIPEPRGSSLVPGTVSTSAGTVTSGNSGGDTQIVVDMGTVDTTTPVTVSFQLNIDDPFDQPAEDLTVQATATGDAVSDDSDTLAVPVAAAPDVVAELEPRLLIDNDNDGKANPTDVIRYTVRIQNDGDQTADQVVFTLNPPLHAMLLSVSVQQGANVVLPNQSNMDDIQIEFAELSGNSVRVDFDFDLAVIDLPLDGSKRLSLQGDVEGQNFASAITDDPTTGAADDPTVVELGELKRLAAPTTCDEVDIVFDPGSNYGAASQVTDKYVVIGAPDLPSVRGSGVVIVYLIVDGELICDQVIEVPEGFTAEEFGAALYIDGDTLVVGAPGEVTTLAKGTQDTMQAAIFQRLTQGWAVVDTMKGENGGSDDKFGAAVYVEGSTVVVGAPNDSENETVGSGAAYVFNFDGANATVQTKQKPASGAQNFPSKFGTSVAASGGMIAVGSPGSPEGMNSSGAVNLFSMVGNNLSGAGTITQTANSGDNFGTSLAMSNGMLAVGAPGDDSGGSNTGAVYAYTLDGNLLMDTLLPSDPSDDSNFGTAVAFDGQNLVAGAPGAQTASSPTATAPLGAVYQYVLNQQVGQFNETQKIGAFPAQSGLAESQQEGFGTSVSLFGDSLVIGAPTSEGATGAAAIRLALPEGELIFFDGFEVAN